MTFKDDVKKKTGEFLSNSLEMFDKIFAQATRELKIKRKPKPAVQKPVTAPSPKASRIKEEAPKASRKPVEPAVINQAPEKVKARPQPRPKAKKSSRKGSRVLRVSLLLILLLVLAGFAANHFALIDLGGVPDLLGLAPKPIVQAPIPRKQPVKPAEKAAIPQKPSQAEVKVPAASPAPSVPKPPAVSKEERLVELETPTTVARPKRDIEPAEKEMPPPPAPKSEQPKPVPVQPQAATKPAAPEPAPSPPVMAQYPYSVYLGSFKAPEAVKRALSDYQEKGLSAYWARVDLGEKGVWYRFFTGYFRTKEETEQYISERNLQGAAPGVTKYANFIGSYGSDTEAEDQKRILFSAGFYPYVIKAADGRSLVYSGAFDRKEYAEKERALLASKGFRSEVVER